MTAMMSEPRQMEPKLVQVALQNAHRNQHTDIRGFAYRLKASLVGLGGMLAGARKYLHSGRSHTQHEKAKGKERRIEPGGHDASDGDVHHVHDHCKYQRHS